jgi:lipoprotein-anchoring transpeptidase ErfK/SrfK
VAVNPAGTPVTKTATFTTLTPGNMTMPYLNTTGGQALQNGATYGIGIVPVVHFDEQITDRKAAEKALTVTTSTHVTGVWNWVDAQNAHWRAKNYLTPGTRVTVSAKVYGVQVGPGLYGQADQSVSFRIGAKHVTIADDKTHLVKVYFNNKLVRTMPTSMGQGGYVSGTGGQQISLWTMPGTYTVIGHGNPVLMDSSTFGLPVNSPKGYKEYIYLATQISTDGIYLHDLETTIWAQGNTDVSHGCLNLNLANAQFFYNTSQIGDIVQVTNSGGPALQIWQNGDWSVPWTQWVKGSALH